MNAVYAPSVGRAGSHAPVAARTLCAQPPASSRTTSTWCAAWLNTTPPPCAVSSSSAAVADKGSRPPWPIKEVGEIERGDHLDVPVHAAVDELARAPVRRVEAMAVADDQLYASGTRRRDHGRAFGQRHRHGLLDQDVLAVPRRHDDMLRVELVRCGEIDRLDIRVGTQGVDRWVRPAAEVLHELPPCFGPRVGRRHHLHPRVPGSAGSISMKARPRPATPNRNIRSVILAAPRG